jgi:hypothetical protein
VKTQNMQKDSQKKLVSNDIVKFIFGNSFIRESCQNGTLYYGTTVCNIGTINLYELASRVKSKLLDRGWCLISYKTKSFGWTCRVVKMKVEDDKFYLGDINYFSQMTFGKTEYDAVFESAEYVIKEML